MTEQHALASEPSFAAAVLTYHRARNAYLDYRETVQKQAISGWEAAKAGVPHVETINSYMTINDVRLHYSTANLHQVGTARAILAKEVEGPSSDRGPGHAEYLATLREIIEITERRDDEIATLCAGHRYDEVAARSEALAEAADAALVDVLVYPAASLADLAEKVGFVETQDAWEEAQGAIAADIRRLASGAVSNPKELQS